ncbi:hydrolase [Pseudomonas aeruginosa]|nr:hydrolase [Pseudomonas aeruginosa]
MRWAWRAACWWATPSGALMATAYAAGIGAARVRRLVLLSPARGYGAAELRDSGAQVRRQRLENLERFGIDGMASERTARLLGRNPSEEALAWVRWNMARLNPEGYRQAVELLCGDDLLGNGQPAAPCEVHCGEDDGITTPESCGAIARQLGASFSSIPGAGHASPIEQPEVVAGRIGHAQRLSLEGTANG